MFQFLQEYFILDTEEKKKQFLRQFSLRFKEYRSSLYKNLVKDSTPAQALDRCPADFHPNDWRKLVAYWMSPKFQVSSFIRFNDKFNLNCLIYYT